MPRNPSLSGKSSATIGFEAKLWLAADKLRNNMDAAEYKHVVLGLIFLKYISDTFEQMRDKLLAGQGNYEGADPEDADEYRAENVFWVPKEARWSHLQGNAKEPAIGKLVDDAMVAIERDNPRLKGVLPKDYARPGLDKHRLGELIDLIGTIALVQSAPGKEVAQAELPADAGHGKAEGKLETQPLPSHRSVDLLGRVYEYFLTKFASAEGKNGGQFYTPSCIVRLLVEMLAPYKGRVYDPCCGSGGMFVQSEKFVEVHGGKLGDISIFGQESNATTRRLAIMNLAIRGIEADFGPEQADTFRRDLHKDLKAQFVLANPPFNDSDWHRADDDVRWTYGTPPKGNANFAWVQHFIHHLAPDGMAGFVLANGSMSSNQSGEGDIRKAIIEADLVDCMVALPGQLFYSTQIPVCLWFLTKSKAARELPSNEAEQLPDKLRARHRETLFIDARKMGTLIDRVHRELTADEIEKIVRTYHSWRLDIAMGEVEYDGGIILVDPDPAWIYGDVPGFCRSVTTDDMAAHGYVLTPGRYVGAEDVEDDGEPFEEKLPRLVAELDAQFVESAKLERAIKANLRGLGYGG
jgi:type I restriction enzyme M protein